MYIYIVFFVVCCDLVIIGSIVISWNCEMEENIYIYIYALYIYMRVCIYTHMYICIYVLLLFVVKCDNCVTRLIVF